MSESLSPKPQAKNTDLSATRSGVNADTNNYHSGDGDPDEIDVRSFLAPPQGEGELGRLERYRILKELGRGGMGMVLLAEDVNLQRLAAIKIMLPRYAKDPAARERFLREARAAAKINHDNVVRIHQVDEANGIPFIAMEFLEGEPLDQHLKDEGELTIGQSLRIGREIAEGLQAAHSKGLVHRDIKPANIWLEAPKGRVKILDFGLAREERDDTNLTKSGAVVGTPAYMSPEQALGKPLDSRSDLFSLGVVLYRLCTGKQPFTGPNTMAVLMALGTETPPPVRQLNPNVPVALEHLIQRLMAKDREQRPASAEEAAEALAAIEKPANSGMPEVMPLVVYVPAATAVVDDPFANIDDSSYENPKLPLAKSKPPHAASRTQFVSDATVSPKKPRSRRLLFAGLGGVLAIVAAFAIIKFTKKDGTVTESKVPDGAKVDPNPKKDPSAHLAALSATFKNDLGMEFVLVPKGKSWLGGGAGKVGTAEVVIPQDFHLGVYEVTQEEWEKVMKSNPSSFKAVMYLAKEEQKRLPVENVSWDDCQLFIKKLNEQARDAGWEYRLPTELEWEYACRGGPMKDKSESEFDYYLEKPSNTLLSTQANFDARDLNRTCKVGSYPPNRLGLYDMHGNVFEWCADELRAHPDPLIKGDSWRMYRGGGWNGHSGLCRAAHRDLCPPSVRSDGCGLRVARVPVDPNPKKDPIAKVEPKKVDPLTFEEKEAKKQQDEWAAKLKLPVEAENKIGMKMILIPPAGTALPKAYYLGKFEVTQGEWEKVMGFNPSGFGPTHPKVTGMDTSKFPVEQVSWFDSVEFCNKLSEQEGMKPYYDLKVTKRAGKQIEEGEVKILGGSGYHIPTDVEWDRGCRAGTKTTYHFGDKDEDLLGHAWFDKNSDGRTHAVGEKKPNGFGLYDMHGNVWEWNEEMLTNADTKAPERVHRGGSWSSTAGSCAVSNRNRLVPARRYYDNGLRLAQVP